MLGLQKPRDKTAERGAQQRSKPMADDASDGEVEDDADWRARVRRLRPFLLDADLVPPPPNPPDTSSSCFASWTRLHAKAPEPPGGFASDAGAKALDALLRDRRQAAPGAFARQCAALGGLDARRSHVLFEGELDIPTEDYYDAARALQNARWSRQRAARAEDDLEHGRWADAVRRFGDAIALDATNGDAYRGRARARVGLLEGVTAKPHQLAEGVSSDIAAARRYGGPRDGDDALLAAARAVLQPAAPAPAPVASRLDAVAVRAAAPRAPRPTAVTAPVPPPRDADRIPKKRKRSKKEKKSTPASDHSPRGSSPAIDALMTSSDISYPR